MTISARETLRSLSLANRTALAPAIPISAVPLTSAYYQLMETGRTNQALRLCCTACSPARLRGSADIGRSAQCGLFPETPGLFLPNHRGFSKGMVINSSNTSASTISFSASSPSVRGSLPRTLPSADRPHCAGGPSSAPCARPARYGDRRRCRPSCHNPGGSDCLCPGCS